MLQEHVHMKHGPRENCFSKEKKNQQAHKCLLHFTKFVLKKICQVQSNVPCIIKLIIHVYIYTHEIENVQIG